MVSAEPDKQSISLVPVNSEFTGTKLMVYREQTCSLPGVKSNFLRIEPFELSILLDYRDLAKLVFQFS